METQNYDEIRFFFFFFFINNLIGYHEVNVNTKLAFAVFYSNHFIFRFFLFFIFLFHLKYLSIFNELFKVEEKPNDLFILEMLNLAFNFIYMLCCYNTHKSDLYIFK